MFALLERLATWMVPPVGHDPAVELAYRWRMSGILCGTFLAVVLLYYGLAYRRGLPDLIRPATAQEVREQVKEAKLQLASTITAVQTEVDKISANQDTQTRALHDDRVERLDQQLLWVREKNCTARNAEAKRLYFGRLADLLQRYRAITGADWRIPNCNEVGNAP